LHWVYTQFIPLNMPNKAHQTHFPLVNPVELGRVTKAKGKLIGVWFHPEIVALIDRDADATDLDRSQWIRKACESQLPQPAQQRPTS
jgi:hypothetical protein